MPSEDNPADMLSRGVSIEQLSDNDCWWHGPRWLTSTHPWPATTIEAEVNLPEMKVKTVVLTVTTTPGILERFSRYRKLVRVLAYCLRWTRKNSSTKMTPALSLEELEISEKRIARMVQQEDFSTELHELQQGREVFRKSKLRALDPYLDEEGLIRVGGRLRNAMISEDQKHPIVLPAKHFVTSLIMKEEHERLHHCPPEQLLSSVRHRYWPISGRREAHKVVRKCIKCFRFRPSYPEVKMGDLPAQ